MSMSFEEAFNFLPFFQEKLLFHSFFCLYLTYFGFYFGFSKSCPQDIRHHFTVYYFRSKAAAPHTLLIIHINSVETKKEKFKQDGVVMKEGEIVGLEEGNIGRERQIKFGEKRNMT